MDINSLLSPSETPRAGSQTAATFHYVQGTQSGPVKAGSANSPLARGIQPPSSIPAHIRSSSRQPSHSSPLISPVPAGTISTPQYPRSSSTQSMDTLADLASMQTHQPLRSTPALNSRGSSDSLKSSLHRPSPTSNPRGSFDITMVETPKQLLRGDFTGTSLPLHSQQRLAELVRHIQETPSAYDAHIEVIKILHQGFRDHIYPSSSPSARRDPRTYDLLAELRQARENADKVFALGEEQWLTWLQDESMLAQSAEERLMVADKCRRAVSEEYGSPRLWFTYGDWVLHCHDWAHDPRAAGENGLPDDERLVGRDLFPQDGDDGVLRIWDQAIEQTKHDIGQSHLVWNKYLRVRFPKFEEELPRELAKQVMELFQTRLQTPHAEWDLTFQSFSGFVSANFSNEEYEEIMASTLRGAAPAKAIWTAREQFESAIAEAMNSSDQFSEYEAFISYIQWEKEENEGSRLQRNRGKRREQPSDAKGVARVSALFQRAELRVPSVLAVWDEHINFVIEKRLSGLPGVLSRATKHCPWSGSLWKQYLLSSEMADEPFQTIEAIKHDATKTGMLDSSGIEEVLKVHDAWCGYLLRRTRRADSTEEDADVAEMGIRTSMEAVQSLASKLDLAAHFDASFRLQRKYVEYLKGQGRLDNAEKQFKDAITVYGKHYRFWLRFYEFEVQKSLHINSLQQNSRDGVLLNSSAPFAVAILKQGLDQADLDYPEYLIEALLNHCEDYEDAEELQAALLLVKKIEKQVAARRQKEAEAAIENAAAASADAVADDRAEGVANNLHITKRKREEEERPDSAKRARGEDDIEGTVKHDNVPQSELKHDNVPQSELKRDREHASILVQNVPKNASETRIRQYFTPCGNVQGLKSLGDDENSFIVEFGDADEAQYALSRNGQDLDGSIISIILNTGSTLYVTNYLATADEAYIRDLFHPYGEIIGIRFPSLQGNKRRRFCYVEFKLPEQAQAALELDGHEMDGLSLLVKISNPSAKKQRMERQSNDCTVFVGQLPFKATEEQLVGSFSLYGDIESLKMPKDANNKSRNKGIAFITYSDAESAQAALEMDSREFQGRNIKVSVTEQDRSHQSKSLQINGRSKSPTSMANGDAGSPSASSAGPTTANLEDRRQRTVALSDVPDTVNEPRIRALATTFGPVRKVILKIYHQGALVEFENVVDAGKAAIDLNGYEIDPGRRLRVTTETEMLQQKAEKKVEKIGKGTSRSFTNAPVKRPAQAVTRRGGHLGQRSAAIFKASATNEDEKAGPKSNDDFRAMLKKI